MQCQDLALLTCCEDLPHLGKEIDRTYSTEAGFLFSFPERLD